MGRSSDSWNLKQSEREIWVGLGHLQVGLVGNGCFEPKTEKLSWA